MLQHEIAETNMGYIAEELKNYQLIMECSECNAL